MSQTKDFKASWVGASKATIPSGLPGDTLLKTHPKPSRWKVVAVARRSAPFFQLFDGAPPAFNPSCANANISRPENEARRNGPKSHLPIIPFLRTWDCKSNGKLRNEALGYPHRKWHGLTSRSTDHHFGFAPVYCFSL